MYRDLFSIGPLTFHGYGLMIALGVVAAMLWVTHSAPRRGLSADFSLTLLLWALLTGFAGAKLLYIIVNLRAFLQDPLSILGSEGFVVYGGILVGVLAVWLCCRRKGAPFARYADLFLPAVALAQGFGRIGCYLAGCCYGMPTDSFLGVVFPSGCAAPAGVPLLPTQLFSAAADFLLALALVLYARRERRDGSVSALYLIFYGIGRFLMEIIRAEPRLIGGVLTTSQFISIFITAAGLGVYCYVNRKRKEPGADDNG